MMTYEPWTDNSFLVRFEHIVEKNEDPKLSLPVTIDLAKIFSEHNFEFSETTLAGNQWIDQMERLQFKKVGDSKSLNEVKKSSSKHQEVLTNTEITLNPMQIRTFVMELSTKERETKDDGNHGVKTQMAFANFVLIVSISSILKMIM